MPGPPRWRTSVLVMHMLSSQKTSDVALDACVMRLLEFVQRQARRNPDVVYGDGIERTLDTPERRAFCRKLAAEGMIVLKNDGAVLPIRGGGGRKVKVALIGPNMKERVISGGGSAALKPSYVVTPYDGLVSNAPEGVEFEYEVGTYGMFSQSSSRRTAERPTAAFKYRPTLENQLKTASGERGWTCSFFKHDAQGNPTGDAVAEYVLTDTRIRLNDFLPAGLTPTWTIKLKGLLTMEKTATYELGLTVAGRGKLFVNGKLTVDNWTKQRPGEFFYG